MVHTILNIDISLAVPASDFKGRIPVCAQEAALPDAERVRNADVATLILAVGQGY
jgi:hypothetical protein